MVSIITNALTFSFLSLLLTFQLFPNTRTVAIKTGKEKLDEIIYNVKLTEYTHDNNNNNNNNKNYLRNTKETGITRPICFAKFLWSSLTPSFDHVSDELPAGRHKYVHPSGSVASVSYINRDNVNHNFT
eukprot:Pgem_evm1s11931